MQFHDHRLFLQPCRYRQYHALSSVSGNARGIQERVGRLFQAMREAMAPLPLPPTNARHGRKRPGCKRRPARKRSRQASIGSRCSRSPYSTPVLGASVRPLAVHSPNSQTAHRQLTPRRSAPQESEDKQATDESSARQKQARRSASSDRRHSAAGFSRPEPSPAGPVTLCPSAASHWRPPRVPKRWQPL